jgi:hypothetical protein
MFSYLSSEKRVRKDHHPLRAIWSMVDEVLTQLSRWFEGMYATVGGPSIAPEKLLRTQLLQMLYCDPQRTLADGREGRRWHAAGSLKRTPRVFNQKMKSPRLRPTLACRGRT